MLFTSLLRFARRKSNIGRTHNRPTFRPQVEQLETRLAPATLSTLVAFNGTNGDEPTALIRDANGNLFGTTEFGGANNNGTVFELANNHGSYTLRSLYSFTGGADGAWPGSLIEGANGNLFGTTPTDGKYGNGTFFELVNLNGSYAFQALYNFPTVHNAGVIQDHGNFFGTTPNTASNNGTVFELANSNGGYTLLTVHTFSLATDGADPRAVTADAYGNLFGTTGYGSPNSTGTVFELANHNGSYAFKTLYSFPYTGSVDDASPVSGVIEDASGNLFGVAAPGVGGSGTVFELVNSGGSYAFKVLSSGFAAFPAIGFVDAGSNLFGTALDPGTVFELVNNNGNYTLQTLYTFSRGPNMGAEGPRDIIQGANGTLFGLTGGGGVIGQNAVDGTVFELTPGTPNAIYINNLYELLLHRGTDAGASHWVDLLDNGTPRSTVVQDIESSTEYRNDQINDLYRRYLGRSADPGGLAAWTGLLAGGGSIEQVIQGLVSSPEYFTLHGGNNSAFVSALYQGILNRSASAGEVQGWVNALDSGASRAQVAKGFLTSREYDTDLVDSYYSQFLGRPADPGGQAAWVQALQAGWSDADVLAAFLGSAEEYAKSAQG